MPEDQPEGPTPSGVGLTAVGVALLRALESQRPDPMFADPLAADFVVASGWEPSPPPAPDTAEGSNLWSSLPIQVAVRTRFLDDYLLAACQAGCRQVVLLGAGLDTRAFRLGLPADTRLFELDTTDMLDFKERVLAGREAVPTCERATVRVDLRTDWPVALTGAGLRTDQPTAWLVEGLLIYLAEDEIDQLMHRVGTLSADGSRFGGTLTSQAGLDRMRESGGIDFQTMWRSGLRTDPTAWLAGYGWRAEVFDGAERAAAYGRPLPAARHRSAEPDGWLVNAYRDRS